MTGSRPQGDITVWSVAVTNSPPGDAVLMNVKSPKNENKCDNYERPDVTSLWHNHPCLASSSRKTVSEMSEGKGFRFVRPLVN